MELWLLRHARARAVASGQKDHDRDLTESGREAARKLGEWIQTSGLTVPTTVCVSPSVRTRDTARLALDGLEAPEPTVEPALWEALEEDLIGVLQKYQQADSLLVVGHNPGFEWLVQWLTNQRPRLGIQPGTLAIIDADMPPAPGCGRIHKLIQPSDLA
ncbi:SixA phosphatase family protein [Wenzhouxiangella sp. EGI_FJ10409]|uniref:SixA phosphatase family protein n=1 Tax=Wenzhouxiangella sp. EGI_FJ10409 TaxID=3243767 RepID=UPI0035E0AD05